MTTTPAPVDGKQRMLTLIKSLGAALGYQVETEVEASGAAWIDAVWFDPRHAAACLPGKKPVLRRNPVLPVVAFEVENKTGLNAKHVKGSVSNLNNTGAAMGVIVIGDESLELLKKQKPHQTKKANELEEELLDRVYRWVYAEAQPQGRVVIMSERELRLWAERQENTGNKGVA